MHMLSIRIRNENDAYLPPKFKYLIYILAPKSPTQEGFMVQKSWKSINWKSHTWAPLKVLPNENEKEGV